MLPLNPDVEHMRITAQQFMQKPIAIYNPQLTYDTYGTQIVASGIGIQTKAYIGAVKGTDKELVTESLNATLARNGVETKHLITVLLPFETAVEVQSVLRINNEDWHVLWHNNITMNNVQIYTKVIAVQFIRRDEKTAWQP